MIFSYQQTLEFVMEFVWYTLVFRGRLKLFYTKENSLSMEERIIERMEELDELHPFDISFFHGKCIFFGVKNHLTIL